MGHMQLIRFVRRLILGAVLLLSLAPRAVAQVRVNGASEASSSGGTVAATQSGTWTVSNTTFAATESGTWTVQPGNTANTTAWLVTGTNCTIDSYIAAGSPESERHIPSQQS